ncbi:MAG: NADH-quinone oxidoreductase subunit A [Bacteroidia bacterium]|nr:NADH-quinone oxidoreductase subunit A [Bacteroidia bacterium]MCX7652821.1 NADH-quinone oxidoreductase subunit A [Bacteroidia bacterium]MDW8415929.1 NADH-quinone oxidoreductase subunit A [Bacteroidia bacterium]
MLETYLGGIVLLVIGASVGLLLVFAPNLLAPKRPTPQKMIPYESGMDPVGTTRQRFSVHYYKVAMLFTVFDVELALMYPWITFFPHDPAWAFGIFISFTSILAIGYIYLLRTGVFDWSRHTL